MLGPVREYSALENLVHQSIHPPPMPLSFPASDVRLSVSECCPAFDVSPSRPYPNTKGVSGSFPACDLGKKPREKLVKCLEGEELTRGGGDRIPGGQPGRRAEWRWVRRWPSRAAPAPDTAFPFLPSRMYLCAWLCAWQSLR